MNIQLLSVKFIRWSKSIKNIYYININITNKDNIMYDAYSASHFTYFRMIHTQHQRETPLWNSASQIIHAMCF